MEWERVSKSTFILEKVSERNPNSYMLDVDWVFWYGSGVFWTMGKFVKPSQYDVGNNDVLRVFAFDNQGGV